MGRRFVDLRSSIFCIVAPQTKPIDDYGPCHRIHEAKQTELPIHEIRSICLIPWFFVCYSSSARRPTFHRPSPRVADGAARPPPDRRHWPPQCGARSPFPSFRPSNPLATTHAHPPRLIWRRRRGWPTVLRCNNRYINYRHILFHACTDRSIPLTPGCLTNAVALSLSLSSLRPFFPL